MIKYKSHLLAVTIDTGNTMSESSNQVFHRREQHIGQHRAFEVTPETFNQIQARTIRRQPENGDLIPMCSETLLNGLGMVKSPIVTNQTNPWPGISGQQGHQKKEESSDRFWS